MKEKYTRLASNTAIFTIGKFVSKLIVIFMLPFYTSCLSNAEYSTADLITNLCNLIIPIAALGVGEGIFREAAGKNDDKESFFTNGLLIMLCGTLLVGAISPCLLLIDTFSPYIYLILLYILASNIHSVCSQYVCAIGKTKLFAFQGILNTAVTVISNIILLAGFKMGVEGYVLSILLGDFVSAVFIFFYARLYKAIDVKKIDKNVCKDLLRFSLPLVPSTVFWWVTGVSDRYMVAFMRSEAENGLYAVAYKIPTLLTYVVTIFNDAWKLSAVSDVDNIKERENFYSQIYKYYQTVMFIGGCVLCYGSWVISKILFAEGFMDAWIYVPILTVATVFTAFDTFLGSAYFTVKKTSMSFYTSLVGAVLNIVLNLLLIPRYGAMGASVATFISYFVVFVVRSLSMKRFINFKLYPVKCAINTLLLLFIAITVTLYGTKLFGMIIAGIALLLSLVFNMKDILDALKSALNGIKRKGNA